ncbi:MAG: ABC transporter ATP-binding protein, partial [Duncaniella sp.]|nr:ABC transporter ATP-binding protein [Duncaniella sp.]
MADRQSESMHHTMRRIWQESDGSRLRVAATALAGCVNVGVSLLFVWTTKSIVDAAVAPAHIIPTDLVALLVACLLAQLLLPALRRRLESVAYTRYADNMRRRLLHHLLCERWSGRGAMQTGDALSRLHDDVATLASLTCATLPGVISVMLQLAGAFVFLAILDMRMAAAIVFIMPLAMLVSKAYVRRTRRLTEKIRAAESSVHSFLQE